MLSIGDDYILFVFMTAMFQDFNWTNFIWYRICFRLNELFKSTRAVLYMEMDIWSKRYKFTYISRPGLVSNFNSIRSFFINRVKPLRPWRSLFSWVCVSFAWASILSENFLIPLNSNHLYELLFAVTRVVQIFPNLLLATDRWVSCD